MAFAWTALIATVCAFVLPIPWWAAVLVVVTMAYWLGPVLVYVTQRTPAEPRLELLAPNDPSIPVVLRDRLEARARELATEGFASIGLLNGGATYPGLVGYVQHFRHATERDLAHVLVIGRRAEPVTLVGEVVGFSRRRADGSYVRTTNLAQTPTYPPMHQHDTVRLPGLRDLSRLYRVHRHRAGGLRGEAPETLDAVAFQTAIEQEVLQYQQHLGYWRRVDDPEEPVLRPTLKGALLMTWRLLPPWRQIEERTTARRARALLDAAA
ncbi:MAG TPA: hypothetical protein VFY16_12090 [Gemmatimonadaceae bacterium]|nr:hypothetical protein [Gemmatimonadaceae bacterium]